MTTVNYILIAIFILGMLAGLWYIYKGITSRLNHSDTNSTAESTDKNGIPIIPRHERNVMDEPDIDDTLAGETTISPDRSHLQAVIEDEPISVETTNSNAPNPNAPSLSDNAFATGTEYQFDEEEHDAFAEHHIDVNAEDEPDIFSSLASATENLMPAVDVADEPEFANQSPVIDGYISAMDDQNQNSPIENAEDTIEIILAPKDGFHQFSGSSLLQLVEQFGMRYGVMNLFHRYEDKDGTGMLWFSMIGMGVDGMSPFDLNTMPHTDYQGVALFLSLPHPKALQGFDSMMSIAGLMAKQLDARITLGDGEPLTRENKHHLRNHVQDYMQAYQERG